MAMTRLHYNAVAAVIAGERENARKELLGGITVAAEGHARLETTRNIAYSLSGIFESNNPRFDRDRFFEACGISNPHSATGEAE